MRKEGVGRRGDKRKGEMKGVMSNAYRVSIK